MLARRVSDREEILGKQGPEGQEDYVPRGVVLVGRGLAREDVLGLRSVGVEVRLDAEGGDFAEGPNNESDDQ